MDGSEGGGGGQREEGLWGGAQARAGAEVDGTKLSAMRREVEVAAMATQAGTVLLSKAGAGCC